MLLRRVIGLIWCVSRRALAATVAGLALAAALTAAGTAEAQTGCFSHRCRVSSAGWPMMQTDNTGCPADYPFDPGRLDFGHGQTFFRVTLSGDFNIFGSQPCVNPDRGSHCTDPGKSGFIYTTDPFNELITQAEYDSRVQYICDNGTIRQGSSVSQPLSVVAPATATETPTPSATPTPTLIPTWGTVEGNSREAQFGTSLASAGDVNGDGFSDVIVGAPKLSNGNLYEGAAFVFPGSARGLLVVPVWQAESNQTYALFGGSVSSAGDVNNDGFDDVIVGAYAFDNSEEDEGQAQLFLGSATGLSSIAAWTAEANRANARFGWRVASAGDVNGDGRSDVIVSAQFYNNGRGRAYVYYGTASGLEADPSWVNDGEPNEHGEPRFGSSVASAGDVNGDGFSDVIVGASHFTNCPRCAGAAYVFLGSSEGLPKTYSWRLSPGGGVYFGETVASAGDVNGDGFSDVIVGDGSAGTPRGRAYLFKGSARGLETTASWIGAPDGNLTRNDAYFGEYVSSAGDINKDGYSDVIVGATYLSNGQVWEGGAYLFLGSAAGLSTSSVWRQESDAEGWALYGVSVASAGDVNADGYSEVLVGALGISNGEFYEGRGYLYSDFSQFRAPASPTNVPAGTAAPQATFTPVSAATDAPTIAPTIPQASPATSAPSHTPTDIPVAATSGAPVDGTATGTPAAGASGSSSNGQAAGPTATPAGNPASSSPNTTSQTPTAIPAGNSASTAAPAATASATSEPANTQPGAATDTPRETPTNSANPTSLAAATATPASPLSAASSHTPTSTPTDTPLSTPTSSAVGQSPGGAGAAPAATATALPSGGSGGLPSSPILTECDDLTDNDNDGLVDTLDPECQAPGAIRESNLSAFSVTLEGIYDNKNGSFSAYFSYRNDTGRTLVAPIGDTSTVRNFFSPGSLSRGQPTQFFPGHQRSIYRLEFDGSPLVWTVKVPGFEEIRVPVSAESPKLSPIKPFAECIYKSEKGGLVSVWGYENPNDVDISIPLGPLNTFLPGEGNRGQPARFLAGLNRGAFAVRIAEPLEWRLAGASSLAAPTVNLCSCPTTNNRKPKQQITKLSLELGALVFEAADQIERATMKRLSATDVEGKRRLRAGVQRAKKRSAEASLSAQDFVSSLPADSRSCADAPPGCSRVDDGPTLEKLRKYTYDTLALIRRMNARSDFIESGATKRGKEIVRRATAAAKRGLAEINKVPRFRTVCK